MGLKFKLFNWNNAGAEPSDDLKTNGFKQGYKPAAGIFNRFWHLVTGAIKELQSIHEGAIAQSTDGIAYTVTIEGITELYNGLEIVVIPERISASTSITLDVNGTGAKAVRLPYSMNTSAIGLPELPTFFGANRPVKLMYCAEDEVMIGGEKIKGVWRTSDKEIVSSGYLSGNVPTGKGGTGMSATNGADLATKLAKELTVAASSTDGLTYTANIEGITELYNGLQITIIPNKRSEGKAITLNINELGAIPVRQPLSFSTFVATSPDKDYFLYADTPCRLMYHANYTSGGIWLMADKQKTSAQDLYGTVPVESGGTGNTSVDTVPTSGSTKMVTSDGICTALSQLKTNINQKMPQIVDFGVDEYDPSYTGDGYSITSASALSSSKDWRDMTGAYIECKTDNGLVTVVRLHGTTILGGSVGKVALIGFSASNTTLFSGEAWFDDNYSDRNPTNKILIKLTLRSFNISTGESNDFIPEFIIGKIFLN